MENLFNQKIFNINWDSAKPIYEKQEMNYDINKSFENNVGIIIDNGSYECKAGWSCFENPNLNIKTIVAKPKVQSKNATEVFLVGNSVLLYEQGKLNKKTPFDKNLIMHFGTQEHILDHIFSTLNIRDSAINHPVIFTEPLANVNFSRKNMTEMFFELYNVPKLCYGVDMLFSLYYNENSKNNFNFLNASPGQIKNGLIISSSYQTTHIVPILNYKQCLEKTRRISIGGFHANDLLTKSLHLKYPDFKSKLSPEIIQEIQEKHTYCAKDYIAQLKLLEKVYEYDLNLIREEEKKRMFGGLEMYSKAYAEDFKQSSKFAYANLLPYKNKIEFENSLSAEGDQEENQVKDLVFLEWPKVVQEPMQTDEDIKKRQELRKEQIKRLRESMQKKKEENLKNMEKELKELEELSALRSQDKYQFEEALMQKGFSGYDELQKRINQLFLKLNFEKKDVQGASGEVEKIEEEQRWPLLSVPDEDLSEEQIKMKRIQKMQRNAYLSRLEKREALRKEREKVEELKQKEPENYLLSLYIKKKEILERLKNYKQIRKDLSNRLLKANMRRMVVLAELGGEAEKPSKKRDSEKDDFGLNDEDWEVYRGISRHNLSEDEEEDHNQLNELEAQIMEMDPNYFKYSEGYVQNSILNKHLFLGVDQFRGAELIFQPHIIGTDQAGVIEILLSLLKTMTLQEQRDVCSNVFITGGNTQGKYIEDRIRRELRSNLDCDIPINIVRAFDPVNDAWKGAKLFFDDPANEAFFITKAEYEEFGADYFKEHRCSNLRVNRPEYNNPNKNYGTDISYNFNSISNDYYEPGKKMKLN